MPVVLILGGHQDCHAQHILKCCLSRNLDAVLFDSATFPHYTSISWDPVNAEGVLHLGQRHVAFSDIGSAFWSSLTTHNALHVESATHGMIALNDSTSMLRTLLEESRIAWLNSWAVYQYHKVKPRQLMQAAQLGVPIPDTYAGNNPQLAAKFLRRHTASIYKPVYGGALCAKVESEHAQPAHLSRAMQISPVTLQAHITGTNIRTYVIGERTFSAQIVSHRVDFREDAQAVLEGHTLPLEIEQQAVAITRAFDMGWSAIDWRLNEQGEYYFLEANPSPMFMHFEAHTRHPITAAIIDWLAEPPLNRNSGVAELEKPLATSARQR